MNEKNQPRGWLGQRSVAFWTVVGGCAAAVSLIITLVSLDAAGGNSSSASAVGSSSTTSQASVSSRPTASQPTPAAQSATYFLSAQAGTDYNTATNEIPYFNGYVESESSQEVDGQAFARNLNFSLTCSDTSPKFADYNLGKHFSTFSATLGLSDASKSGGYQFEVWIDGHRIYFSTLHHGESKKVTISVQGVLSLRVGACSVDESVIMEPSGGGIFGDPQLIGEAQNLPIAPSSS